MKKVVIYGGAFNPPHIWQAIVIETVTRLFPCDEIWVLPSADRHDKTIGVSGAHRVNMIALMLKELFPKPAMPIKISTLELDRPQLTTTYDTKLELDAKYPNHDFYFLVGSDIIGDIPAKWVNGAQLYKSAKFLTIKRMGAAMPANLPGNVVVLEKDVVRADISSTFVRKLLAAGHSGVPYLLPSVARYILENKLY